MRLRDVEPIFLVMDLNILATADERTLGATVFGYRK